MYRVLQGNVGKVADATFTASAAMKRGMLVAKGTDGTVTFPAANADKNVFFVGKEFIATGIDGDRDLPDYNAKFEDIASGESVVLEKPVAGEVYWTDQTAGTFSVGGYALVGTAGKLIPTTTAGKFIVRDTAYSDCGKTAGGVVFEVLD